MKITFDNIERIPEDREKYDKSMELLEKYGNIMFRMDVLMASGKVFRLPFIPYAGDLSEECYVTVDEDGIIVYQMNGYLQPVFLVDYDRKIMKVYNDRIPSEYFGPVIDFLFKKVVLV